MTIITVTVIETTVENEAVVLLNKQGAPIWNSSGSI